MKTIIILIFIGTFLVGKAKLAPYYSSLNAKYGYKDASGKRVVLPTYDLALSFLEGMSVVKVGDKYGFIDKKGKLVVPAVYDRADNFHGEYLIGSPMTDKTDYKIITKFIHQFYNSLTLKIWWNVLGGLHLQYIFFHKFRFS